LQGLKSSADYKDLSAWLKRLLKRSIFRLPHGLKSVRKIEDKRLRRRPEGQLYPYIATFGKL
jgi:hypothetical protein